MGILYVNNFAITYRVARRRPVNGSTVSGKKTSCLHPCSDFYCNFVRDNYYVKEMKEKYLHSFLLGIFLLAPVLVLAQQEWKQYSFPEKHYRIKFYKDAELTVDTIAFEKSSVNTESWQLNQTDSTHANSFYSITRSEYPADFIHSDSAWATVEDFLDSSQSNLMQNDGYTLISSTLLEKNGYPGKDFRWKNNFNNVFFEFQVYLVGNVLYQLSVIARPGRNDNVYSGTFFDSFGLFDLPAGNFHLPDTHLKRTYGISFPGEPKEDVKIVDAQDGKQTMLLQTYQPAVQGENLMYMAAETVYTRDVLAAGDSTALADFYAQTIKASVRAVNGGLISVDDVSYADNPGKEYRASLYEGKALLVYRVFLIGRHLYAFGVITANGNANNPDLLRFLDSFKVLR